MRTLLRCATLRRVALGGLLVAMPAAMAADPALEARVERLEKTLGNQSAASLLLQVQRLQQEMQELRGLVELQQYKINALTGGQATATPAAGEQPLPPPIEDTTGVEQAPGPAGAGPGAAGGPGAGPAFVPPVTKPIDALDLRPVAPSRLPPLPSPETTAGGEREAYKTAFDLLKDRRYGEAQKAFRDLLARYPQGQYADNARYWLAESSYSNRDFPCGAHGVRDPGQPVSAEPQDCRRPAQDRLHPVRATELARCPRCPGGRGQALPREHRGPAGQEPA